MLSLFHGVVGVVGDVGDDDLQPLKNMTTIANNKILSRMIIDVFVTVNEFVLTTTADLSRYGNDLINCTLIAIRVHLPAR